MQITSKGQVTIPQEIRNRAGESARGCPALEALRATADVRLSTD